jgi:hypothetical protein
MDIVIKSFNRAYCLDRCLHSIRIYLKNFKGNIYILEDGTPQIYLDKILKIYPEVIILKSDSYLLKSELISKGEHNLPNNLPVELWFHAATLASDYFIVLEDDIWFTEEVDCLLLEQTCMQENIGLLKLIWLGNPSFIGKENGKETSQTILYKPKLKFKNILIFKLVYTKYRKIWRKLLTVLGIYSYQSELNYYSIYSVAGAVFKKVYFLDIWKNASSSVNEKQQLIQALEFYKKHEIQLGRTTKEVLKTSFISSAFMKKHLSEFNIHDLNATLNKHWLEKNEVFISSLESDISINKVERILIANNKSEAYIQQWKNWATAFKNSFINAGCKLD